MLTIIQDTSKVTLYKLLLIHYLAVRGIDIYTKALQLLFTYTLILERML